MNKKLLAAAVAAAVVAAPTAFADSVVYGKFHTSVDQFDADPSTDNWQVNSRSSRLGFKGSEDLGNGLKAIYQLEMSISTDGGTEQEVGSGISNSQRNTFVGLSGGWGTVLVGRHDTPDKLAFYATGNERLGDSIIDLNGSATQPIGNFIEARVNNAIAYVSPNFSGFTLAAAVVPGEETGEVNASDGLADHVSLGLMYKGGGLQAGAGYAEYDNQAPTIRILNGRLNLTTAGFTGVDGDEPNDDIELWHVGASYTFGMFAVGGVYQSAETDSGAEYDVWAVTGKATFGNSAVSVVYNDAELDADGTLEADGWGVAAEHNFSKRTKVYAAYADGSSDLGDTSAFSLGVIHDF